jgi:DNA helicase-2/ATP-dependent DNA helicase PcrA
MPLTDEQQAVVCADRGNFVVLAGPGSGKTRTIIEKILHLFNDKVIPEPFGLLAITFTNAAANEMRSRLRTSGFRQWDQVFIGTFHSFCHYMLSCYGSDVGVREDFDVVDSPTQDSILEEILNDYPHLTLSNIKKTIEGLKRQGIYPGIKDEKIAPELRAIYSAYQTSLMEHNLVDFGDLIFFAIRLLEESELSKRLFTDRFHHILVDEFQDTDPQQLELIKILAERATSVSIVADDDQSIYGWRGADRRNVETIAEYLEAKSLQLGINFRSDQVIVEAAEYVIQQDADRTPKAITASSEDRGHLFYGQFADPVEEANYVGNRIIELLRRGVVDDPGQIAIIARARWRVEWIIDCLDSISINWFDRSRLNFIDDWDALLAIAVLKLAIDPESTEGLYNVMSTIEDAGLAYQLSVQDAIDVALELKINIQETIIEEPSLTNIDEILVASGFWRLLEQASWSSTEQKNRIDNANKMVEDLIRVAEQCNLSLQHSLDHLAGLGAVQILTGQGAKGREFDQVFFIGLEEGVIPDYRADNEDKIAEERRIFYVGLTRARKAAYLSSVAQRPTRWGNMRDQEQSRFISHIPVELIEPFP